MELFDSNLSSVIDSTLGMRCRLYGYQYSEIIRSLMSVYFCGGSCVEVLNKVVGVFVLTLAIRNVIFLLLLRSVTYC